jgi:hypothetical protein
MTVTQPIITHGQKHIAALGIMMIVMTEQLMRVLTLRLMEINTTQEQELSVTNTNYLKNT